jgi:hypothetical protein
MLVLLSLSLVAAAPSLQIDFPNGGEVLRCGSEVRVLWHSIGVEGNLAILLFKDGEQYAIIAAAVPNSGAFQWRISPTLPDGGRYRLRICSLRDLRVNDFSDRDFAIHK